MAAHLSHKIRWNLLVDYLTPYSDCGIAFPVGECGRIHASKKKHQIQIVMRKYISDDMICTDEECETKGEKRFRKSYKKGRPFEVVRRLQDNDKFQLFFNNLVDVISEFASTELKSPVKTVEYPEEVIRGNLRVCQFCDEFITYLEFGDKQKLFEYSDTDLKGIFSCIINWGVGNPIDFALHHILKFYISSNVILHLGLTEDRWPAYMRPNSRFRRTILYACDGQTFLPNSRKYLDRAMIDLNETRTLSKNLFRFVYFYVMMRMKLDSSYDIREDFDQFFYWSE